VESAFACGSQLGRVAWAPTINLTNSGTHTPLHRLLDLKPPARVLPRLQHSRTGEALRKSLPRQAPRRSAPTWSPEITSVRPDGHVPNQKALWPRLVARVKCRSLPKSSTAFLMQELD
jgi:hypothetical protein